MLPDIGFINLISFSIYYPRYWQFTFGITANSILNLVTADSNIKLRALGP